MIEGIVISFAAFCGFIIGVLTRNRIDTKRLSYEFAKGKAEGYYESAFLIDSEIPYREPMIKKPLVRIK